MLREVTRGLTTLIRYLGSRAIYFFVAYISITLPKLYIRLFGNNVKSRKSGSPRRFAARDDVRDRLMVNSMKILYLCKALLAKEGRGEVAL